MQALSSVKARSVPYALQKAVDEEYDRLESDGGYHCEGRVQ